MKILCYYKERAKKSRKNREIPPNLQIENEEPQIEEIES